MEAVLAIVEAYFDVSGHDSGTSTFLRHESAKDSKPCILTLDVQIIITYMEETLAELACHVMIFVAVTQHKLNGREEVALASTITTNDDVALRRERRHLNLFFVATNIIY